MISLDENFARTFSKPALKTKDKVPQIFIVESDHPWLERRRIEAHATLKGAQITAAEMTNEIRENFVHRFDLYDGDVPEANCTNYADVLEVLIPYDSNCINAVRIEPVELKLL
jgi:hypothetical protein